MDRMGRAPPPLGAQRGTKSALSCGLTCHYFVASVFARS
jgi:hypothetical protein